MNDEPNFRDRGGAGAQLAAQLSRYARDPSVVVLGLPRGGVPVAYQVARALKVPLDVFVVRKLGVPGQKESAMGAIASGGVRVLNPDFVAAVRISEVEILHKLPIANRRSWIVNSALTGVTLPSLLWRAEP